MKTRSAVLSVPLLSLGLLAAPAHAATIDLSWNACSPLVANVDPERPGVVTLLASVTGMSDPHSAYEVWLYVADPNGQLPDAWRFDAAGCQGPERVRISPQPSPALAKACPPLPGADLGVVTSFFGITDDFDPATDVCNPGTDCSLPYAHLTRWYGSAPAPDPGRRYFLASWEFDLTNSVAGEDPGSGACGGWERGVQLWLHPLRACYLRKNAEPPYDELVHFEPGQNLVSYGDGEITPAATTTWGQIKSAYRR